jgi:putative ABC transport system permease protein
MRYRTANILLVESIIEGNTLAESCQAIISSSREHTAAGGRRQSIFLTSKWYSCVGVVGRALRLDRYIHAMIVMDSAGFSSHERISLLLLMLVFRSTPISLLNLISQPTRAMVSILGVAFALLLIFMQLGFRGAVGKTATIVYGKLSGDIVMRSPDYVHLYEPRTFDRSWLTMAASHPDVEIVSPFFIMLQRWQNPARNEKCTQSPPDGSFRTVGMMGMELERPVIQTPELLEKFALVTAPNAMLVDRATRAEYGPENCKKFSDLDISKVSELGGRATRIVGHFHLGTGLATNGAVLVNDVGFGIRAGIDTRQRVSLGLIQVKGNCDPTQVRDDLVAWMRDRDPRSELAVQILTMEQQKAFERRRWLSETPIGMIFSMGVVLSFIIGAAIVYMVLATDVASRLPEYATLKAMGYSPWYLAQTVLRQAWLLAVFGYLPAVIASLALYEITTRLSDIPTAMTWQRAIGVFGLSLLMCTLAGLLAIRKIWKAEPASLF